jgi:hypothetical protein
MLLTLYTYKYMGHADELFGALGGCWGWVCISLNRQNPMKLKGEVREEE